MQGEEADKSLEKIKLTKAEGCDTDFPFFQWETLSACPASFK